MTTYYVWGQRIHDELPTGREKWMQRPEFGVLVQALTNFPHKRLANAPGFAAARKSTPEAAGLQLAGWCNWYSELARLNGRSEPLSVSATPNGFGLLGLYDESHPGEGIQDARAMLMALRLGLSAFGIADPAAFPFDIESLPRTTKDAEYKWLMETIGEATAAEFPGSSYSFFSHGTATADTIAPAPRAYRSDQSMTLGSALEMIDGVPSSHLWIKPPGDYENKASGLTHDETRELLRAAYIMGIETVVCFSKRVYPDWHRLVPS